MGCLFQISSQSLLLKTFKFRYKETYGTITLEKSQSFSSLILSVSPRGYFHIRRSGRGIGRDIRFRGKTFGAISSQDHQKREKSWEVLLAQDTKVLKESHFWGAFGVISEIQILKFGIFVTYIFGGKSCCSETNFRGILGPSPPPDMEVPPGEFEHSGQKHLAGGGGRASINCKRHCFNNTM